MYWSINYGPTENTASLELKTNKKPTQAWSKYYQRHITKTLSWYKTFLVICWGLVPQFFCIIDEFVQAYSECGFIMCCHEEIKHRHHSMPHQWHRHYSGVQIPLKNINRTKTVSELYVNYESCKNKRKKFPFFRKVL